MIVSGFVLAYVTVLVAGDLFYLESENITLLWPASGLLVSALLLSRFRIWPVLLALSLVAHVIVDVSLHEHPFELVLYNGTTNALESLIGALLVRGYSGDRIEMGNLGNVLALIILAGLVSTALGGFSGAAIAVQFGAESYWVAWYQWWFSHGLGVLVVTPSILAYTSTVRSPLGSHGRFPMVELGALFIALVLIAQLVFGSSLLPGFLLIEFPYLVFPPMIWAALRFQPLVPALTTLIIGVLAVWNYGHSQGPFYNLIASPMEQVLALQSFIAIMIAGVTVLSAVVTRDHRQKKERDEATLALRTAMDTIHECYLCYDKDLRLKAWNDGFTSTEAPSATTYVGLPLSEELEIWAKHGWFGPGDPKEIAEELYQQYKDGTIPAYEERMTTSGRTIARRRYRLPDGGYTETESDITERVKAEQSAKANEALFNAFMVHTPNLITIKDLDGRYLHVSQQFCELYDLQPEQVLGRHPDEILDSEIAEVIMSGDQFTIEQQRAWNHEITVNSSTGAKTFMSVRFPVKDHSGSDIAVGAIATDITEIREQQALLAENEERQRLTLEAVGSGGWDYDVQSGDIMASDRLFDLVGYKRGEIDSNALWTESHIHPDDLPRMREAFVKHVKGESEFYECELRVQHKSGHYIWLLMRGAAVSHDDQGRVTRIVGANFDIDDRKTAEQALVQSEQQFRGLVEGSIQGIYIHNIESILFANEASAQIFGYKNTQEIRSLDSVYDLYAAHELDRIKGYAQRRMRGEKPPQQYEFDGVKKDGTVIRLRTAARQVTWKGKNALQIVVVDITEQHRAEMALNLSERRYRRLFEAAPVSLWEQDWSGIKQLVERLQSDGIKNVRKHLKQHPELIKTRADVSVLIDVNSETLRLYGATDKKAFIDTVQNAPWQQRDSGLLDRIQGFLDGKRRVVIESEGTRIDGTKFPIRITTEIVNDDIEDWSRIYTSDQDITEEVETAKRLEAYQGELRSLAGQISLAEESERRRIASELHDGTVQNLVVARINIAKLQKSLRAKRTLEMADSINELLEKSLKETRSLIFDLSPPVLYELGLEAALEWLIDQFKHRTGIAPTMSSDNSVAPLSEELKVVVFQAVRELLVNVAKHANASHVNLSWSGNNDCLELRVEDDGVGFDPSDVGKRSSAEGGFGLFSLRERLGLLGASIDFQSSASGTCVILNAPLESE